MHGWEATAAQEGMERAGVKVATVRGAAGGASGRGEGLQGRLPAGPPEPPPFACHKLFDVCFQGQQHHGPHAHLD